jgi:extracellular elastinolytic metalloproteinase
MIYFSKHNSLTHIYIQQRYQGINIFNAISSIAIKDNKIVHFSNSFVKNIQEKTNTISPTITPEQALQNVIRHFNLDDIKDIKIVKSDNNNLIFSKSNVAQEDIPANLVYTLTKDNVLKLAWNVTIYTLDSQHKWNASIDAVTGELLEFTDLVLHCNFGTEYLSKASRVNTEISLANSPALASANTLFSGGSYSVFPLPLESPNHGPMATISNSDNPIASPYGWHDTNGAAGAEYTITRGNNTHAYEDNANANGPGYSPDGGASLVFDYPFNAADDPLTYRDASITNLFYITNMMHDIFYEYGFDEVSGNFQENNYGRGGAGSDYVLAEAQDGGGTNNANFATPADGTRPRMQMYLWTGGGALSSFDVNSPVGISDRYDSQGAGFGSESYNVTGNMVLVDDGTANPSEGCNPLINGGAISGNIAVIYRGTCQFGTKALNAQNAGAIAVVVINNAAGSPTVMGPGVDGASVTIPAIMISQSDGALIAAELAEGVNATLTGAPQPNQLDGSFDNGIVAHEYGHGISTRLTGGPASNCLNGEEQMGEGWSDWFGLMVTLEPGDLAEDRRGIGTYAGGEPTFGGGIRTFPYSTDTSINPHTYDDIKTEVAPHGVGSVWAAMLWDLTWALIDAEGFDPDLYRGSTNADRGAGNNIAMRLVLDGIKLQGCSPSFIDGRDAILFADEATYGGDYKCLIWSVFAARGLGFSATAGSPNSKTDGTEAFDLPVFGVDLTNSADVMTSVDEGQTITFNLGATPYCNDVPNLLITDELDTSTLDYVAGSASNGGTFTGSTVSYPEISNLAFGTNVSYTFQATVKEGTYYAPVTLFEDAFDNGTSGWIVSSGPSTFSLSSAFSLDGTPS